MLLKTLTLSLIALVHAAPEPEAKPESYGSRYYEGEDRYAADDRIAIMPHDLVLPPFTRPRPRPTPTPSPETTSSTTDHYEDYDDEIQKEYEKCIASAKIQYKNCFKQVRPPKPMPMPRSPFNPYPVPSLSSNELQDLKRKNCMLQMKLDMQICETELCHASAQQHYEDDYYYEDEDDGYYDDEHYDDNDEDDHDHENKVMTLKTEDNHASLFADLFGPQFWENIMGLTTN